MQAKADKEQKYNELMRAFYAESKEDKEKGSTDVSPKKSTSVSRLFSPVKHPTSPVKQPTSSVKSVLSKSTSVKPVRTETPGKVGVSQPVVPVSLFLAASSKKKKDKSLPSKSAEPVAAVNTALSESTEPAAAAAVGNYAEPDLSASAILKTKRPVSMKKPKAELNANAADDDAINGIEGQKLATKEAQRKPGELMGAIVAAGKLKAPTKKKGTTKKPIEDEALPVALNTELERLRLENERYAAALLKALTKVVEADTRARDAEKAFEEAQKKAVAEAVAKAVAEAEKTIKAKSIQDMFDRIKAHQMAARDVRNRFEAGITRAVQARSDKAAEERRGQTDVHVVDAVEEENEEVKDDEDDEVKEVKEEKQLTRAQEVQAKFDRISREREAKARDEDGDEESDEEEESQGSEAAQAAIDANIQERFDLVVRMKAVKSEADSIRVKLGHRLLEDEENVDEKDGADAKTEGIVGQKITRSPVDMNLPENIELDNKLTELVQLQFDLGGKIFFLVQKSKKHVVGLAGRDAPVVGRSKKLLATLADKHAKEAELAAKANNDTTDEEEDEDTASEDETTTSEMSGSESSCAPPLSTTQPVAISIKLDDYVNRTFPSADHLGNLYGNILTRSSDNIKVSFI